MIKQIKTCFKGSACSFFLAFLIAITPKTIVKADFYSGLVAFVAQDYLKAFKEFKPAAVQGDAQAQLYMGYLYESGWGVAQDYQLAADWFRLSVEQGNPEAQWRLAYLYGERPVSLLWRRRASFSVSAAGCSKHFNHITFLMTGSGVLRVGTIRGTWKGWSASPAGPSWFRSRMSPTSTS